MSRKRQECDYNGQSPGELKLPLKNHKCQVKNVLSVEPYRLRSFSLSATTSGRSVRNSQTFQSSNSLPSREVYSTLRSIKRKHARLSAGKRYVQKFSKSPKIVLKARNERQKSPKSKSLYGTRRYGAPKQERSEAQTSSAQPAGRANASARKAIGKRVESLKTVDVKLGLSKDQRKSNEVTSALKVPLVLLERLPASLVCRKSPIKLSSLRTLQSAPTKTQVSRRLSLEERKIARKKSFTENLEKSEPRHSPRRSSSITYSAKTPYRQLHGTSNYGQTRSAVKAVPNFSDIHRKIFAKSESLLDARARLEKRHSTFHTRGIRTRGTKTSPRKLNPTAALDKLASGSGNRVGVKLRKSDATDYILRKRNLFTSAKKRQEETTVLKGVRTNRRFDLQLKFRKIDC